MVNVCGAVDPTLCADVPDNACGPDHAPDAVHEVAFSDDQVSVNIFSVPLEDNVPLMPTMGRGTALVEVETEGEAPALIFAVAVLVPPGFEQMIM